LNRPLFLTPMSEAGQLPIYTSFNTKGRSGYLKPLVLILFMPS